MRHAMPDVDPAVPPQRWRLGPAGTTAAAALRLPPRSVLVASDEPKAAETVRLAAGPDAPGDTDDRDTIAVSHLAAGRGMLGDAADGCDSDPGGRRVVTDARFGEVRRPAGWHPDHRARARAYVEGAEHDGWEPRSRVVARFTAAIAEHAARAAGRPLVVGTHGMAMTCWLAAHRQITGAPGDFWAALAFPEIVEVQSTLRMFDEVTSKPICS